MTKRLALGALLALCLVTPSSSQVIIKTFGSAAACSSTSITFWWRIEVDPLVEGSGFDHTAGATDADLFNGAVINTASPKIGTYALTSPGGSANTYAFFDVGDGGVRDIFSDVQGKTSIWVKWASGGTLPANGVAFQIMEFAESSANVMRLLLVSDGSTGFKVSATYRSAGGSTVTVISGSVEVLPNVDYHLQLEWDTTQGTNLDTLKVYVNDVVKAGDSVQTLSAFDSNPIWMTLGMQHSSSLVSPMYFDQWLISSDHTKDLYICRAEVGYP